MAVHKIIATEIGCGMCVSLVPLFLIYYYCRTMYTICDGFCVVSTQKENENKPIKIQNLNKPEKYHKHAMLWKEPGP